MDNTSSNYCALQAKLACAAARNASSASQVQFISSQKYDSEESVLLDRMVVSLKLLRGALKGMSVSDLISKHQLITPTIVLSGYARRSNGNAVRQMA